MNDFGGGPFAESKSSSEQAPWSVAQLSGVLKDWIEKLGTLWVEGEIAQISRQGTRVFGELRDLNSENSVSIHSWDSIGIEPDLKQGDRVVAFLRPRFWGKGGKLTMEVKQLRKVGLGELLERIERLRQQLVAEGLTDVSRKQKLPFLPNKIGLITGADSDAEKDVLQNSKRRWPEVDFRVINTKVQGNSAVAEIIAAIKELDADPEVDVIIIARGGGAFTDLVVFSDEQLVRAAAATSKPLVSAIGHENDSPLLDLVADLRASTPTDAAKKVVPDVVEERAKLAQALANIRSRVSAFIDAQAALIESARSRPMLANPFGFIEVHESLLTTSVERLRDRFGQQLELAEQSLGHLRQQVRSLSPQSTLDRGYAVVQTADGKVVVDSKSVAAGSSLRIRVAKGSLDATAGKSLD
jgi:exodeoxyribonuclease VII large subunit